MVSYYESDAIDLSSVEYKEFTVKEIYDALEQNGLKHLREEWISTSGTGKVVGGCILGQGAYNLKTPYSTDAGEYVEGLGNLEEELNQFTADPEFVARPGWSNKAGTLITQWNDAHKLDKDGRESLTPGGKIRYELATYKDVLEKARQILEPHFEKTVKLPHYEY